MKTSTHAKLWTLIGIACLIAGTLLDDETLRLGALIAAATAAIISEIGEAKAANHTQGEG